MLTSRTERVSMEMNPCHLLSMWPWEKSDGVIWFLSLQRRRNNASATLLGCCVNLLTSVKLPESEEAYISARSYSHSKCFLLRIES